MKKVEVYADIILMLVSMAFAIMAVIARADGDYERAIYCLLAAILFTLWRQP